MLPVINFRKQKNKIIAGAIVLVLLAVATAVFMKKDQIFPDSSDSRASARLADPKLVTLDFYNQWLDDLKSTTTTPYDSGLINSQVLSKEVRAQIERARTNKEKDDVDPVLCLPRIPNKIISKEISTKENKAVVLITPRDRRITTDHQAIVSLTKVNDAWLITKIDCTIGEMAIEKEFDFEKSGSLVKQSIEAPYSKENWHLVYEQETQPGYVMPLTFTAESVCINTDKTEGACDLSKLTEATVVFVQATMTETGAVVKRMTFE